MRCAMANDSTLSTIFDGWAKAEPVIGAAYGAMLHGAFPSKVRMWDVRDWDYYPIDSESLMLADYHPFESRFTKALSVNGFKQKAEAFAGVLREMADNVVQHSNLNGADPQGLVGYHVTTGRFSMSIGDTGSGVLNSLKTNPEWEHLTSSTDALLAVVHQGASRRPFMGRGEGFAQLFKSILDHNGEVELRSLDGRVTLKPSARGRHAVEGLIGSLPGFQLTIECSIQPASGPLLISRI